MEKWTQEQYAARLQEMKQEAHDKMWLYIEVNAKEFMNECEPGVKNLAQREEILNQIPEHLTFTNFLHLGGEITHSEYNKATAIQFVKNYYKEKYDTVAMGDSENDLPMLEYADISIAMGNGVKEVKEKADYVTDKIDNDGLYKAFKHLKLF